MLCLRCGSETQNDQVFCDYCLKIMEQRPVKPGTAAQIPEKPAPLSERYPALHRRVPSPGEQLQKLRGTLRWMAITVLALSVVLMLTAAMLIYTLVNQSALPAPGNLGRNYTSIGNSEP